MLLKDKHAEFLERCWTARDLDYYLTEPSRVSVVYWIVNSYKIMNMTDDLKTTVLQFVKECKNLDGGYGGSVGYPSTILTTFNALQILYIYKEDFYDENTLRFVLGNFNINGTFENDIYGMTDNRINCSGVLSLHLLWLAKTKSFSGGLGLPISYDWMMKIGFNYKKCLEYTLQCYNFDGGFGVEMGDESHCAFIFCCLSVIRSLGGLTYINKRDIGRFISLLQGPNGGFSGRFDKKEDVCYSFWAYAALKMIGKDDMISKQNLTEFILKCQSPQGGVSDRPGNEPDPYHLMFSLGALSLLGYGDLTDIDPGFAI